MSSRLAGRPVNNQIISSFFSPDRTGAVCFITKQKIFRKQTACFDTCVRTDPQNSQIPVKRIICLAVRY